MARKREHGLTVLTTDDIAAIGTAQRELDAKRYAEWAAKRALERYGRETILDAGLWVVRKLRRAYLVQEQYIQYSYDFARELAKSGKCPM